ncbi:MAG: hypothetical protein AABW99_01435 [archaeon]
MTMSISDKMKERMNRHREIRWSEVARGAIAEKLEVLEKMDEILSKSSLTEKDALRLGRKVNKAVAAKY